MQEFRLTGFETSVLKPIDAMLLAMLVDGPSYGYELGNRIETASKGKYRSSSNLVYRVLKMLRNEGLIETVVADQDQGVRRGRTLYRLTPEGFRELRRRLLLLRFNLASSVNWIDDVLSRISDQKKRKVNYQLW